MTLGDKIVLLKDGKIQQVADPLNLYHKPANIFVAGFIGSPPMNFIEGELIREGDTLYFQCKDLKVQIPREKAEKLKDYGKREITMGLRPEHIKPSEGGNVKATVDLVETLGNEVLLYLNLGEASVISRIHPGSQPDEGTTINLSLDMEKAHFFDKETGINLTL
jgi:multiple sugar transport system ATP-binding protein